jgi:hypothetical protein
MTSHWNLPVIGMFTCQKCRKTYDTVVDRTSVQHACPHCGALHIFDPNVFEQKMLASSKKQFQKMFGK